MDALEIQGPSRLSGTVRMSGSKNSALPMLFASLLLDKPVTYHNVPRLWDIETTLQLLNSIGTESVWDKREGTVEIFPKVLKSVAGYDYVKRMRAGILALGPLVAKHGYAEVSLPGGCAIGARPVNFHTAALEALGVHIEMNQGNIVARAPKGIRGGEYSFPQVSVTGTENILMAASLGQGTTILRNAAREPEVVALGRMLQSWGAAIEGLGTDTLTVHGRELDAGSQAVVVPSDRIEAGTWLAAAAITRSSLALQNVPVADMEATFRSFRAMGVGLQVTDTDIQVFPSTDLEPLTLQTAPYPGFATDMQAQLMAVLCTVGGTSVIEETIFENRFMHVAELRRMGAHIDIEGNRAIIRGGVSPLRAAPVMATDLRASASLVLAALVAEGTSRISRIYHLDRGYQRLDEKLVAVGANVRRVSEES